MVASAGRQRYRWLVLLASAVILLVWMFVPADRDGADTSGGATATSGTVTQDPDSGLPVVRLADLPPEAARILALIDQGGPFGEDEDGGTFQNREDLLPDQPMGYYREYTVPTPGTEWRGARRIVAGDEGDLYWTGDHYRSFSRIAR